jgi:ribosomal protein L16 Arg81 hydroxylase
MLRDLASLLAPASEQTFLDRFLQKARLHVKSDDPARAVSLFPWSTINQLIELDLLPPDRLRVLRANTEILPSLFRHSDGERQLRPGALQSLLRQGVSLVINGVADLVPQIGRLTDAIERRLGYHSWANAYLSFGRGSAFRSHWDPHDVLVLQIHGRKRWRSYGTPMPFPLENHGPIEPFGSEVVWEDLLEPGDVLYLPRGEVHQAELEGTTSVHITIGIQAPRGVDFLRWVADKAAADVPARMDLERLSGEAALCQQERELKARLHAMIDSASLADYLEAEDAKRKPRPLLSLGLADRLVSATMIVPSLRRRIPVATDGEAELAVTIGGESYRLSPERRRVLAHVLECGGLTFGALVAAFGTTTDETILRDAVIDLCRQGLVGLQESS